MRARHTHTWAIKYRKGMTFLFVLMKLILPSWCAEEIISWNDEYKRFWRTIPVFVCEFQSFFSLSLPLSLFRTLSLETVWQKVLSINGRVVCVCIHNKIFLLRKCCITICTAKSITAPLFLHHTRFLVTFLNAAILLIYSWSCVFVTKSCK